MLGFAESLRLVYDDCNLHIPECGRARSLSPFSSKPMDDLTTKSLSQLKAIAGHQLLVAAYRFGIEIVGDKRRRATWVNFLERCWEARLVEESPGVDRPQEPIAEGVFTGEGPPNRGDNRGNRVENFLDADRTQGAIATCPDARLSLDSVGGSDSPSAIEFPDMESALAEIARLRAQKLELLERVRSQSEITNRAKDISPVQRCSFIRVLRLARAACLDVSKTATGEWILSMGSMTRQFKRLKQIWELLIPEEWNLMDLFDPLHFAPRPRLPKAQWLGNTPFRQAIESKYLSIPFCDDKLIDIWSLEPAHAAGGDRAPPVAP